MNKCIIIIGRESTGSKLIAKIIAHSLDIIQYGYWEGHNNANANSNGHIVIHKSLPNGNEWTNVNDLIEGYSGYEIYFVITTRDETLTSISRRKTYSEEHVNMDKDGLIARNILLSIINSEHEYFIWSYESFMYLGIDYLKPLCKYLGIDFEKIPDIELIDANKKRILEIAQQK